MIEFYEGEFNNDKITSIMVKAGLNGVFAASNNNNSAVREMFIEMKKALVGEGISKI